MMNETKNDKKTSNKRNSRNPHYTSSTRKPKSIKDAKNRRARRRKLKRLRLLICTLFLILICLALSIGIRAVISLITKPSVPQEQSSQSSDAEDSKHKSKINTSGVDVEELVIDKSSTNTDEPVKIVVSSIGDCTLGTDVNFNQATSLNAYYETHGPDYFFKNVRPILENDDLSIVNMEGTLTTSEDRQDKTFAFKGPAEYAKILSGSSVEAANMANNHSRDYGEQSYTDTLKALEDEGIVTFGYEHVKILDIKGVKVGVTGIYELAEHLEKKQQVKENIAALKESGAQLIIINFHWGIEREYIPNDTQKQLAHLAIDEGADLVIGHHPHVLQGVEKYKDKYIAYSLGNFCFGGNSNPGDKDTMIFQQTFTISNKSVEKNDDINIIPCSLSSSGGYNDYCPTVLEGAEKQRVLDKIKKYSEEL